MALTSAKRKGRWRSDRRHLDLLNLPHDKTPRTHSYQRTSHCTDPQTERSLKRLPCHSGHRYRFRVDNLTAGKVLWHHVLHGCFKKKYEIRSCYEQRHLSCALLLILFNRTQQCYPYQAGHENAFPLMISFFVEHMGPCSNKAAFRMFRLILAFPPACTVRLSTYSARELRDNPGEHCINFRQLSMNWLEKKHAMCIHAVRTEKEKKEREERKRKGKKRERK